LWGTWPLWLAHSPVPPATQAAFTLGVVAALGVPLTLVLRNRRRNRPSRRLPLAPATRADLALLGLFGVFDGINNLLYFGGLGAGSAAAAAITHYLAPVLVAMLAPVVLAEPLARRTPLAIALAFGGTVVLLACGGNAGEGTVWRSGVLGAGSAIFYAADVLIAKRLTRAFTAIELLAYHAVVASLVLLPFSHGGGLTLATAARLAGGGLVCGLVAGVLYLAGLSRTTAQRAGVLSYLEPAVVVLVGWAVLGQRAGLAALAGGIAVAVGGALSLAERLPEPTPAPQAGSMVTPSGSETP
jgi:drug/metabolite transporter (DMT)-like permease